MGITTSKFIHGFLDELMLQEKHEDNDQVHKVKQQHNKVEKQNNNIEIQQGGIWDSICDKLLEFYGDNTYNSWLSPLRFISYSNGVVTLSSPTKFICEWISTHYIDNILSIWRQKDANVCSIELIVREDNQQKQDDTKNDNKVDNPDSIKEKKITPELGSPLDPRFTFDNFVVGKPNELAFAASRRVAESSHPIIGSNPLFLYGGVGLGKTHLMHAIAWYIRNTSITRKVVYLSAEKFMYHYITALRNKDIMDFKNHLRSVDVLMVDDVQFISGKDSTQEEFFHTFNTLIDQKKQLIISADRSPSDLSGVEDRIKSRLGWGLVADINDTTFELRMGILQSKIEQMGVNLPLKILEFIAKHINSNIRELEGALNKVVAHGSLIGRGITLDITRDILSDLLRSNNSRVTIEHIQQNVAEYFNIKMSDMHSGRRLRNVARPRQVAMYFCKLLTQKSLPEIGKKFGRDHATVIHSNKKIEALIATDPQLAEDVNILLRRLK